VQEWVETGDERVVVHWSAGLYRTGIYLCVLLRRLGETSEQALAKIREMWQATFDEFVRLDFQATAELIFAQLQKKCMTSASKPHMIHDATIGDISIARDMRDDAQTQERREQEDEEDEEDEEEEEEGWPEEE